MSTGLLVPASFVGRVGVDQRACVARRQVAGGQASHEEDSRPSRLPARLASPVAAESFPVPANDSCWLNEEERASPAIPKAPQAGPDKAICEAEARAPVRGCENGELVSEGKILQDQISTGFQGTEQSCCKSEGEIRHWPGVLPGTARTSTIFGRMGF